jgi:Protein of unknwon function (DUF3310)
MPVITDKTFPVKQSSGIISDYEQDLQTKYITLIDDAAVKVSATNALAKQVGGGHYKEFGIQPVEYIHANNLSFLEGNVVKYITRHKSKNGIEDIKKVIHYCELIIELEYNQKKGQKND